MAATNGSDEQRKRVLRIEKELGLSWTTLTSDYVIWKEVSTQYAYQGTVPQYMLLNRDGTLYAGTSKVDMGRGLEALLDEMLANESGQ